MSTDSYMSSGGTTDATSPSIAGSYKDSGLPSPASLAPSKSVQQILSEEPEAEAGAADVEMHPCEPKRASSTDAADHSRQQSTSLPREDSMPTPAVTVQRPASEGDGSLADDEESEEEWANGANSILLNTISVEEVFGGIDPKSNETTNFLYPRLPRNINLRNLNIQPIKYTTISDIVLYAKKGTSDALLTVAEQIAKAQDNLYNARLEEYYRHVDEGEGEGLNRPIRYGVWVILEPFLKIEQVAYHLVNVTSKGQAAEHAYFMNVFDRENKESRYMTRATEVVEGFWVGNDSDAPNAQPCDGARPKLNFDLCIRASEMGGPPSTHELKKAHEKVLELDEEEPAEDPVARRGEFSPSPATVALRNLLTPVNSLTSPPVSAANSSTGTKRSASPSSDLQPRRTRSNQSKRSKHVALSITGYSRNVFGFKSPSQKEAVDKVVELIYWLRNIIERRDGSRGSRNRQVLVHCQDGYTESSIIVLAYIMSSLSISLPEAYLHLQNTAQRSFFLYSGDKPLLRKVDERFAADRKAKALKLLSQSPNSLTPSSDGHVSGHTRQNSRHGASPTTPTGSSFNFTGSGGGTNSPRWKNWGLSFGGKSDATTASSSDNSAKSKSKNGNGSGSLDDEARTMVEMAKQMLEEEEQGGRQSAKDAKVWFEDTRFDGFPSRILPFLYLGNLYVPYPVSPSLLSADQYTRSEHAGNAAMLEALSISHVVSVGESLIKCPEDTDPMYGQIGSNTLCAAEKAGRIKV